MTTAPAPSLQLVKPSEIATHPSNPRKSVGDVDDLVASIKEHGVLEPLVVAPWPDTVKGTAAAKRKHLLIAGHRRLAAATQAKLAQIPVVVREDLDTEAAQLAAMLVENLHRADLTPIEEANGYQLLMDLGDLTQAQCAAHLGQSKTRVRDRIKLTRLPEGVQGRVHNGQITVAEAIDAASFADDAEVMKRLEKAAGTHNFAHELALAKAAKKDEQEWRSLLKQIRDAGYAELYGLASDREDGARPVSGISGLYSYAWNNKDRWANEKRLHGDCPHGAVIVHEHGSKPQQNVLTFMCMQPHVHNASRDVDDTNLPETPEARAAKEAADAERTEREEARLELQTHLDAAASVRRAHVASVLHHKTGDEDLARRLMIEHHNQDYAEASLVGMAHYWSVVAGWLDLDPDLDDSGLRLETLRAKLDTLTLPALAMSTRLAWHAGDEANLANSSVAHPSEDEDTIAWIHHLTDDFAYPWSDFEREHFGLDTDGHVPPPAEDES